MITVKYGPEAVVLVPRDCGPLRRREGGEDAGRRQAPASQDPTMLAP